MDLFNLKGGKMIRLLKDFIRLRRVSLKEINESMSNLRSMSCDLYKGRTLPRSFVEKFLKDADRIQKIIAPEYFQKGKGLGWLFKSVDNLGPKERSNDYL